MAHFLGLCDHIAQTVQHNPCAMAISPAGRTSVYIIDDDEVSTLTFGDHVGSIACISLVGLYYLFIGLLVNSAWEYHFCNPYVSFVLVEVRYVYHLALSACISSFYDFIRGYASQLHFFF